MLRITKFADYAASILSYLALCDHESKSASQLAQALQLPRATVSKILKKLTKSNLLASHRGAEGGYRLARIASAISVLDIIQALEGPVAMTACTTPQGQCEQVTRCRSRIGWKRVNQAIVDLLADIYLSDLAADFAMTDGQLSNKVSLTDFRHEAVLINQSE